MDNVVPISRGHKLRNEKGETMHLVAPGKKCFLCGGGDCVICGEFHAGPCTDDPGVYALHTNPCKKLLILGEEQ